MRHGSLFSGIGGFDLAAEWMGWENVFHCENNIYCRQLLKKLFPKSVLLNDIKNADFTIFRGVIDILTGGDPCQPNSVAGLGKGTADDRFLWPEMFRAIREIQPTWITNENVVGSVSNGVLDLKIDDLESIGYSCQAYNIPAEAVGALHQRERIWLVAYNADFHRDNKASRKISGSKEEKQTLERQQHEVYKFGEPVDLWFDDPDPNAKRLEKFNTSSESEILTEGLSRYFGFGVNAHGNFTRDEIKSRIIRMLNGLPEGMDYNERNKRIKALGNSVVPQVVHEIFQAIEIINQTIHHD